MDALLDQSQQNINAALEALHAELASIRASRPNSALIENIRVKVYQGAAELAISELALIATGTGQDLVLEPFDISIIEELAKALNAANLGASPVIDGKLIRLAFPPLSAERRQELVKLVSKYLEGTRIQIRQIRQKIKEQIDRPFKNKEISEDEKFRLEKLLQKQVDQANKEVEEIGRRKEQELTQI